MFGSCAFPSPVSDPQEDTPPAQPQLPGSSLCSQPWVTNTAGAAHNRLAEAGCCCCPSASEVCSASQLLLLASCLFFRLLPLVFLFLVPSQQCTLTLLAVTAGDWSHWATPSEGHGTTSTILLCYPATTLGTVFYERFWGSGLSLLPEIL